MQHIPSPSQKDQNERLEPGSTSASGAHPPVHPPVGPTEPENPTLFYIQEDEPELTTLDFQDGHSGSFAMPFQPSGPLQASGQAHNAATTPRMGTFPPPASPRPASRSRPFPWLRVLLL